MSKSIMMRVLATSMMLTHCSFASNTAPAIHDQKTATISVRQTQPDFIIKLKSNPTTGYIWSLHNYDRSLLASVKHEFHAPKTDLVGAPGYELWTFHVKPAAFVKPVRTVVSFVYARPWEKSQPADSATFVVKTHL